MLFLRAFFGVLARWTEVDERKPSKGEKLEGRRAAVVEVEGRFSP